jgi:type II secretory pathway component PulK
MKGMRMMRASCVALMALALMSSLADAAVIDWQAELQRCRALRESVAPLLQAGEGISAVGRSNRSVRRCIWIQRIAVRRKIPGAEVW